MFVDLQPFRMKSTSIKINYIIAHDLRDALASISGISDILISNWDEFPPEEKLEILEEIKETSDSTMRLLSDLLEWGKKMVEFSETEKKVFNAGSVIKANIQLLSPVTKRKKIVIKNLVPPECWVFGDENMFAAISRNLLANAIKSCLNKGQIEVKADPSGALCRFCVADNGIGMTKSKIDNFFPDDVKMAGKTIPDGYSNGFGLILCRDFVNINGGTLWAESEEGLGTSVFFTYPEASFPDIGKAAN